MPKKINRANKFEDTFVLPAGLEYRGFAVTCKFSAFWEDYEPDTGFGEQWTSEDLSLIYDTGIEIDYYSSWTQTNLEAINEAIHEHCEGFYEENQ